MLDCLQHRTGKTVMKRHELIQRELKTAIASANAHAKPDYTPENLKELPIELKQKMTRAELIRYGLNGTVPEDLETR